MVRFLLGEHVAQSGHAPTIVSAQRHRAKRPREPATDTLHSYTADSPHGNNTERRRNGDSSTPSLYHDSSDDDQRPPKRTALPAPPPLVSDITFAKSALSFSRKPTKKELAQSEPLDMTQQRTSYPCALPMRPNPKRLYNLQHCPVFHPTEDEFKDPIACIEKYAQECRRLQAGICKVVPPPSWDPPFMLDTKSYRFKTRVQRLNSMEASARATKNFLEQLQLFHTQQRQAEITIPTVGGRPLDLWRMRKEVVALGGHEACNKQRGWGIVARALGYNVRTFPQVSWTLKVHYGNIIAPFEEYKSRISVKVTTAASPASSHSSSPGWGMRKLPASHGVMTVNAHLPSAHARLTEALAAKTGQAVAFDRSQIPERLESPLSELEESESRKHRKVGDYCELCLGENDEANILLCDDCDKGYHLKCLDPPLSEVPDDDWICDECIVHTGADYGFEEGALHSFTSFGTRAAAFRERWLRLHPLGPAAKQHLEIYSSSSMLTDLAVEDHMEREFWRLVESQTDSIKVEYGADLHTGEAGSAITTKNKHPDDVYANHPWNLNNIATIPGSLLRFVNKDISGMTVPWGYVGMAFSTFAWHKEDHYTYSVNYHHFGGTKTWYGVPSEDDLKLEQAMKAAAPELFHEQPDLLYQLVTLMSPGRLRKAGVRVNVCDQRPREFVITMPQAYHAGFNHDFNYNEAVNFCLPDWLHHGLVCVDRYKLANKTPVFSHDALILSIFNSDTSPETARWLLPHFYEMVQREMRQRKVVRELMPEREGGAAEQRQCSIDQSYCPLSYIEHDDTHQIYCLNCANQFIGLETAMALMTGIEDGVLLQMLEDLQCRTSQGQSDLSLYLTSSSPKKLRLTYHAGALTTFPTQENTPTSLGFVVN